MKTVKFCLQFLTLTVALGVGVAHAASPALARIKERNKLVIAYSKTSSPFSYDVDGKPVGYSVDVCLKVFEAVKKHLKQPNLELQWAALPFNERLGGVKSGAVDIECGNTTQTTERRATYNFSTPHYITSVRTMVLSDRGLHRVDDLRGKVLTTSAGSVSEKVVKEINSLRGLDVQVKIVKTSPEAFAALEKREADAFVFDEVVLMSLRAAAPKPEQFVLMDKSLQVLPLALVLPKGDAEFKAVVDKEIVRMMLDGEIKTIHQRWFLSPIPPKAINLSLPMGSFMREQMRWPLDVLVPDVK